MPIVEDGGGIGEGGVGLARYRRQDRRRYQWFKLGIGSSKRTEIGYRGGDGWRGFRAEFLHRLTFRAEGVNGGADPGSVFGGDLKLFAIEVQAAVSDAIGDAAIGGGADASELGDVEVALAELVETVNEVVGLGTADAEMALGVLVPGEA